MVAHPTLRSRDCPPPNGAVQFVAGGVMMKVRESTWPDRTAPPPVRSTHGIHGRNPFRVAAIVPSPRFNEEFLAFSAPPRQRVCQQVSVAKPGHCALQRQAVVVLWNGGGC